LTIIHQLETFQTNERETRAGTTEQAKPHTKTQRRRRNSLLPTALNFKEEEKATVCDEGPRQQTAEIGECSTAHMTTPKDRKT
jgi:hypothetical protein